MHLLPTSLLLALNAPAAAGPLLALPEVSRGAIPYKSYYGTLCDVPTPVMTVPDGQEFIITMATTTTDSGGSRWGDWLEHHSSMLLRDDEIVLAGQHIGKRSTIDVARGDGRLPVGSGSTLSIRSVETYGGDCQHQYYVQGYFVEAGSPYRSFYNSSALSRTVFTTEPGKNFLVRTIAIISREGPTYCSVYVDGVKAIDGRSFMTADVSTFSVKGFSSGKGTLVVTEGQVLEIGPEDPGAEIQCDYYVAGEYLTQ